MLTDLDIQGAGVHLILLLQAGQLSALTSYAVLLHDKVLAEDRGVRLRPVATRPLGGLYKQYGTR